jgi:hypothetical protein
MLSQSEIAAREQAALADCALFEETITAIIYSGLEGPSSLVVRGADGRPWTTTPAYLMTRDNIIAYVRARWGPLFVGFCESRWQFRNH